MFTGTVKLVEVDCILEELGWVNAVGRVFSFLKIRCDSDVANFLGAGSCRISETSRSYKADVHLHFLIAS